MRAFIPFATCFKHVSTHTVHPFRQWAWLHPLTSFSQQLLNHKSCVDIDTSSRITMKVSEPARAHVKYAPPTSPPTCEHRHDRIASQDAMGRKQGIREKRWCDEKGAFLSMLTVGAWHDRRLDTSANWHACGNMHLPRCAPRKLHKLGMRTLIPWSSCFRHVSTHSVRPFPQWAWFHSLTSFAQQQLNQ